MAPVSRRRRWMSGWSLKRGGESALIALPGHSRRV
jgi:hypothetical protein